MQSSNHQKFLYYYNFILHTGDQMYSCMLNSAMHTTGADTGICILRSLYNQTSEQWLTMLSGKNWYTFPFLQHCWSHTHTHIALELLMLAIILKPMPVPHPLYVYSASTLLNHLKISYKWKLSNARTLYCFLTCTTIWHWASICCYILRDL